jgi:hypothetical protein
MQAGGQQRHDGYHDSAVSKPARRIPTKRRLSAWELAKNLAVASAEHAAAGFPKASDEDVATRFAICQQCELYEAIGPDHGRCLHKSCGCNLKAVGLSGLNKLRWAEQSCPIRKWQAVTPSEPPA